MTPDPHGFDTGLQAERTALAWRRTALALLVTTALIARLAFEPDPVAATLIAAAGTALAACLEPLVRRRLTRLAAAIRVGDRSRTTTGGAASILAAAVITLIGTIGFIAVFTS